MDVTPSLSNANVEMLSNVMALLGVHEWAAALDKFNQIPRDDFWPELIAGLEWCIHHHKTPWGGGIRSCRWYTHGRNERWHANEEDNHFNLPDNVYKNLPGRPKVNEYFDSATTIGAYTAVGESLLKIREALRT